MILILSENCDLSLGFLLGLLSLYTHEIFIMLLGKKKTYFQGLYEIGWLNIYFLAHLFSIFGGLCVCYSLKKGL